MSASAQKPPTPAEVDELAQKYFDAQEKVLQAVLAVTNAQQPIPPMKDEMVELIREFGSTHAEKSKVLNGIEWKLMATFGTYHSLDAAAVERFRLGLVKAKQARLLKKIFTKSERWDLSPEAEVIIKGCKLSKSLLALYSQCDIPKPKNPSLKVEKKQQDQANLA